LTHFCQVKGVETTNQPFTYLPFLRGSEPVPKHLLTFLSGSSGLIFSVYLILFVCFSSFSVTSGDFHPFFSGPLAWLVFSGPSMAGGRRQPQRAEGCGFTDWLIQS